MVTNSATPREHQSSLDRALAGRAPLRVGIVCDFLEEGWPSMDLVGDMLTQCFQTQLARDVTAIQLRPAMRQRLTRIPFIGGQRTTRNWERLLNRFVDYPKWLRQNQRAVEVFHLVDHSYAQLIAALPEKRTVVTCHDLDTFRCLLEPQREARPAWFRAMTKRILDGFRKAARVITVSQSTRDELLRYDLLPPERISVIANGVHPSCTPSPDPAADVLAAGLMPDGVRDAPWLLNVGSTAPRKRLDVLLRVFAEMRKEIPDARLVRVGGFTETQMKLIQELGLESAVVNLPFLERPVLAAVYRRATLLLHTAEAEGFGLPLIEAMACGCPVVASDLPVLREVGGAAACYCRVADISAWKQTTLELLQSRLANPSDWQLRRQAGLSWAGRFSWLENARKTAQIYRSVIEER